MSTSNRTKAVVVHDHESESSNSTSVAEGPGHLTAEEELFLQQLEQARFWSARQSAHQNGKSPMASISDDASPVPDKWELTRGISLHSWQSACIEAWFKAGKRGVLKVVTGAGKTILALAIAERLQRAECPALRVAIVVPSVVLLQQWQDELTAHGNLLASSIGLLGAGHNGSFTGGARILVCVLNSAAKKLPADVAKAGVADNLLLIVDECHRAGSAEMKHVFGTKRSYSLGLSATPERENDFPSDEDEESSSTPEMDEPVAFADSVLGRELGPVVFEMNYADAIRQKVLPPFRIVHYGLSLGPKEREKYERLSHEITDLRKELETGSRRGLALIRWCRSRAGADNPRAAQFLALTVERKRLLYRIDERFNSVREILERAYARNTETKAILFHESIEEVMRLFDQLREAGYAVVAEHSEFPDAMRAESLRLFRKGTARVIVSARSLIEGFNVPTADLGIVVAASASVRQRVQTLGRLLRRSHLSDGAEKQSTLYVLYAAGTVDEMIYSKADWEQFVGAERNEYFLWQSVDSTEPLPCADPPRRPPVDESRVDERALVAGGPYPGDSDQGRMYSLDTHGTIRDEFGKLLRPHAELQAILAAHCRGGGRFRITPRQRFVTKLEKTRQGWQTMYLGRLDSPVELVDDEPTGGMHEADYSVGDPYPLAQVKGKTFSVLQRDKRLVARKHRGHVDFVVPADELSDVRKQSTLRQIQRNLAAIYALGHKISKITVTENGHVVYVFNNQAFFVGQAPEGAAGFMFEESQQTIP